MPKLPDIRNMGGRQAPSAFGPVRVPQAPIEPSLGQGLGQTAKILEALQDDNDTVGAEDGYNRFIEKKIELSHGENGYLQQQGKNAVEYKDGLYNSFNKQLDGIAADISAGLANDSQRMKFQKRAEIASLQFKNGLLSHATAQNAVHRKQVFDAKITTGFNDIISNWADPNTVKIAHERMIHGIKEEARKGGMSDEARDLAIKTTTDKVHTSVIDQAIEAGDIEGAKAYYKENGKGIVDKTGVYEKIIAGEINIKAENAVDSVFAGVEAGILSDTDALAKVRKMFGKGIRDQKIEKEAVARLKLRMTERNGITANEFKVADNEGRDIYVNNGNRYSAIPQEVLDRMSGAAKINLQKIASGTMKTDRGRYHELQMMQRTPEGRDEFVKVNLGAEKLSTGDYDKMMKLQSDMVESSSIGSQQNMIDRGAADLGLNPLDRGKVGTAGDNTRAYYDRMLQEFGDFQADNGRKPTRDEMRKIIDGLSIEIQQSGWLDKLFGATTKAYKFEIEGVPPDMVDDLARAIQEQGQPVTEDNIQALFLRIQGQ